MRLAQYLAAAGVGARRKCESLIEAGQVEVNGVPAVSPACEVEAGDRVSVDGQLVSLADKRYILLYKPAGYTCSADDAHADKLVGELLPKTLGRLFSVGRLDRDSEGLLLMTNDGEWANLIAHPRHGMTKLYRVWCRGPYDDKTLVQLRKGVYNEGEFLKPARVFEVSRDRDFALLEMLLGEGRKREIRRLCFSCGLEVLRLMRLRIGSLKLLHLKPGKFRELTPDEVDRLRQEALGGGREEPAPAAPPAKPKPKKPVVPAKPNPVVSALQRRLGAGK